MKAFCEITPYGVFVGKIVGECIRVSIPANTPNHIGDAEFFDLPFMDADTMRNFTETMGKMRVFMDENIGE